MQDPLQGSQQSSLVATLSQASPPFNHTPFPHVAVERYASFGSYVASHSSHQLPILQMTDSDLLKALRPSIP